MLKYKIDMLKRLMTGCLILIIMLAMALGMAQPAHDQPLPIPHQLYGTATVGGDLGYAIRLPANEVAAGTYQESAEAAGGKTTAEAYCTVS